MSDREPVIIVECWQCGYRTQVANGAVMSRDCMGCGEVWYNCAPVLKVELGIRAAMEDNPWLSGSYTSPREQAVARLREELEALVMGREWVTPEGAKATAQKVTAIGGSAAQGDWVVECHCPQRNSVYAASLSDFIYPAVLARMFRYAFAGLEE